jgi:hypothetical protein
VVILLRCCTCALDTQLCSNVSPAYLHIICIPFHGWAGLGSCLGACPPLVLSVLFILFFAFVFECRYCNGHVHTLLQLCHCAQRSCFRAGQDRPGLWGASRVWPAGQICAESGNVGRCRRHAASTNKVGDVLNLRKPLSSKSKEAYLNKAWLNKAL